MSKLCGYLEGDHGTVTKASENFIEATVQTNHGRINVGLNAYGGFSVTEFSGDRASGYKYLRTIAADTLATP